MSDEMVIIHTAHDNAEADIIKGILEEEEITVFVQGYNHHSLLGMVGSYIDINIMVPECDAERAKRCIAQAQSDIELPVEKNPLEQQAFASVVEEPKVDHPKRWMFAIMLPFLLPGLGSYYVGRGDVGGWLLTLSGICYLVFIVFAQSSHDNTITSVALILIPVLMVIDLILSVSTLRNTRKETQ